MSPEAPSTLKATMTFTEPSAQVVMQGLSYATGELEKLTVGQIQSITVVVISRLRHAGFLKE